MEQRIPPHSDEAEKSVLGAMLLSKDALFDAQEVVKREDFYNEAHREIFDGISALYRRNEPVDVLTVTEELSKRKILEMAGGRAYVAYLSTQVPTTAICIRNIITNFTIDNMFFYILHCIRKSNHFVFRHINNIKCQSLCRFVSYSYSDRKSVV